MEAMRRVNDTEWGDLWPDEIEDVQLHNPGITPAECRRRIHALNQHCKQLLWRPGEMPNLIDSLPPRPPAVRPEDR